MVGGSSPGELGLRRVKPDEELACHDLVTFDDSLFCLYRSYNSGGSRNAKYRWDRVRARGQCHGSLYGGEVGWLAATKSESGETSYFVFLFGGLDSKRRAIAHTSVLNLQVRDHWTLKVLFSSLIFKDPRLASLIPCRCDHAQPSSLACVGSRC